MQIKHENTSVNAESTIDGTPVEAGGVISGLFKKLSGIFDKLLNKLDKIMDADSATNKLGDIGNRSGKEYSFSLLSDEFLSTDDEEKRNELESTIKKNLNNPKKWPMKSTLLVKVKFTSGESENYDVVDVYMKRSDDADSDGLASRGNKIEYTDPTDRKKSWEELQNFVLSIVQESWKNFFPNAKDILSVVESSQSIKVTLKKVMANDEVDIELISVNTPFESDRTLEVLNNLTENADFVEALPMNEPASYDVDPEDMSFLACAEEECCDISCSIFKILGSLYQLYFDGMYVVWNAKGPNYTSIVSFADSYVWYAKGLIDQLSAYHYQLFNYAPHPATFLNACNPNACMSALNDIAILQKDLNDIVSNIDLYYCNFEGTLQECLIQAKDMFEKESNYSLARFNG